MSAATETADKIIHGAIFDVALKAAKGAWVYDALDRAVVFAIIDIETEAQRKAYDSAIADVKAMLARPNRTPEEIEKARVELEKRLADLISIHP